MVLCYFVWRGGQNINIGFTRFPFSAKRTARLEAVVVFPTLAMRMAFAIVVLIELEEQWERGERVARCDFCEGSVGPGRLMKGSKRK